MDTHNTILQELFKEILGTEVNIKDNIDATEEISFKIFIEKLELAYKTENKVFEEGGIDLTRISDPLWFVIENCFKSIYGEEATDIILWYIYDRFNPDGTIIPLEDEEGKEYIFKSAKDLWSYIKHRFPQDF